MRLIGVGSQFRNGKDTVANYLNKRLGWRRAALADAVKGIFCSHFGVSRDFVERWKVRSDIPPGFDCTVRESLITIGNGWRGIQADIWLRKLLEANTDDLIVSDVRYVNEAKFIREKGGVTILLWRPGWENSLDSPSEQELMPFVNKLMNSPSGTVEDSDIPFDLWLVNSGSRDDLFRRIDEIVIPYILEKFRCSL